MVKDTLITPLLYKKLVSVVRKACSSLAEASPRQTTLEILIYSHEELHMIMHIYSSFVSFSQLTIYLMLPS